VEQVEAHFVLVELHLGYGLFQFVSLILDHLFALFNFLFLFLKLLDLLVDLLLHHLEQVLMLDLELVHDASEAFLQLVDLLIELFAHFHFKLVVELFVHGDGLVVLIHLNDHLLDQFFHFFNFWRDLNDFVLHFGMLKNTLTAKHASVILTVELNFLIGVKVTILD